MVIQSREEFGKERGSNLLGTEKRLEEDTYITFPLKRGGAAYFSKRKSQEKWLGKRKSFQNQQQPAAEIGALPVENFIIGPRVYPRGSLVIALVRPLVRPSIVCL